MNNKNLQLRCTTWPYTQGEKTIFGDKDSSLEYRYMDRLKQWDKEKYSQAITFANEAAMENTPYWFEKLISHYEGVNADVKHIVLENDSWGNDIYCVGYKVINA